MMRERVKRGVATPLIAEGPGRALLIAVDVAGAVPTGRDAASASTDTLSTYESLEELGALCQAAGAEVVGQLVQRREMPDPRSYFGEGKLNELAEMVLATGADLVVSDDELRPAQLRKL